MTKWKHCRICEMVFYLRRETAAYCNICGDPFCPEHGAFGGKKPPMCLFCGDPKSEKDRRAAQAKSP